MKRDINSGHSRRKWKWLKMIFGFLKKRRQRNEQREMRHAEVKEQREQRVEINWKEVEEVEVWQRVTLTYLVTKHLSTSSCLQTNSMKRGDVILGEEREGGEERRWSENGKETDSSNISATASV